MDLYLKQCLFFLSKIYDYQNNHKFCKIYFIRLLYNNVYYAYSTIYIVQALNNINLNDSPLATALTTVISNLHKMSHQDILGFCCRCQNRRNDGCGEMLCNTYPDLQAISDYLMQISNGAIKGPGGVLA